MRKPAITRTIKSYQHTIKVYDKENDSVITMTVTTTANTEKAVKEELDNDKSLITVINTEEVSGLYSMSIPDFIAHAQKIEERK